jgi:lysine-specific demethylase 8
MRSIPADERALYDLLFAIHHFVPQSERVRGWRDAVRRRVADELRPAGRGKVIQVDRVAGLAPGDFRARYLAEGIPVILDKAAARWACSHAWTFENLKRRYGDQTIKLAHHKGLSDHDFIYERELSEELNFGEFLDQAVHGGTKYARFSPILEKFPELLDDLDHSFLREMPGKLSLGTTFEAFIGGRKTFTPLHNAPTPFFFVNVCGVKRWALIPNHYLPVLDPEADGMSINHSAADVSKPDDQRFPGFESVDRMEAVLEPGDVLFLPSWFWHSVQNEEPTIGVRCGLMYPWSMLAEAPALFWIRVFAARNPSLPEVLYYTLLRSDLTSRQKMLLQPKLHWNYPAVQKVMESPLFRRLAG